MVLMVGRLGVRGYAMAVVLTMVGAGPGLYAAGLCENGKVVPDPSRNWELVLDCSRLWFSKDALGVSESLRWNAQTNINDWVGVTTDGSRVTRLVLNSQNLSGTVPGWLGYLSGLTHLRLADL